MNYFYFDYISDGFINLEDDESKHLQLVLRHKTGSTLYLLDGKGMIVEGTFFSADKKGVKIKVLNQTFVPPPTYSLHIAMGATKQMERLEWFIEKATELGIHQITPILSTNGERNTLRVERLNKIIRTAGKQSGNPYFPKLNDLTKLNSFLDVIKEKNKFIAHLDDPEKNHLFDVIPQGEDSLVLIGPEGDFTEKEVALANEKGFISVHLGKNRLRTETAGIFAAQCLILKNK